MELGLGERVFSARLVPKGCVCVDRRWGMRMATRAACLAWSQRMLANAQRENAMHGCDEANHAWRRARLGSRGIWTFSLAGSAVSPPSRTVIRDNDHAFEWGDPCASRDRQKVVVDGVSREISTKMLLAPSIRPKPYHPPSSCPPRHPLHPLPARSGWYEEEGVIMQRYPLSWIRVV